MSNPQPIPIEDDKIQELRNLKYKGAIKGYIKALISLGKYDDVSIEAVTQNIYESTLEIMRARERSLIQTHTREARLSEARYVENYWDGETFHADVWQSRIQELKSKEGQV